MLLVSTELGLYCEAGGFYVDPHGAVERAIITHAHADHARRGSARYLTAAAGEALLRARLGGGVIETLRYGERRRVGDVDVSLHPAGHVLGSSQARLEHRGEVWVVTGDFKRQADPTCAPFEPLAAHTLVIESTFGLPIFRWPAAERAVGEISAWWRACAEAGQTAVLYAYALGKAQRLLASLPRDLGPIYTHGAVERLCAVYRGQLPEHTLPPTQVAVGLARDAKTDGALVIAPPSAHGSPWLRRFGAISTGFASGWMRVRGMRRRRAIDRGFVISDHADWPALLDTVQQSGTERVVVTHGYVEVLARWLREQGREALVARTAFVGEVEEPEGADEADDGAE
ncbi:MAG: ligase-associated DNA damage response exonuclease [Myxococcales bacterium]|nr:ligase-associated DNA damage response exonuclease [Myxococcales bacterium]